MINLDQALDLMHRIQLGYQPTDKDIQELQEYFEYIMPLLQAAMSKFVEAFAEALHSVLVEVQRVDDQIKLNLAIAAHRDRITRAGSLKSMIDQSISPLPGGISDLPGGIGIADIGDDRRRAMMNHPSFRGLAR